ncbi:MAG: spore cortex biosynthesis protein YabQ [Lachnospiraceae bacterium]|nr:spore cortex biosynthesis protein YabQ [Lachnospiraceae bacterium]
MNREIAGDVRFFLATVVLGLAAALCYDGLRVWRRLHKQNLFTVSVQDFVFWFFLGLAGFRLMYRHNAGTLRLFVLLGIFLGAVVYWVTLGRFFVKYCVKVLRFLTFPIRKGLLFLQKQGKLLGRTVKQVREKKLHGRKGALATEKRKKKNGS